MTAFFSTSSYHFKKIYGKLLPLGNKKKSGGGGACVANLIGGKWEKNLSSQNGMWQMQGWF